MGHYALLGELGRGGMGVVYKAYDVSLRRPVAIKMILDPARAGVEQMRRFEIEASAAARLRHPNIVSVFEVGSHEGKPYLVMELVEGESFESLLSHTKPGPREIAAIVRGLALALQAAHDAGIVHRDVKPENLIVDEAGVPHLMDFGLAREEAKATRLTATGSVLGTPAYMAPEQADGDGMGQGPRTDVYGAGAVLYRALSGRPPFAADSIRNLLHDVLNREPVPLRVLDPSIPADLETISQRCMSKEPERRYPSAAALAAELGRFIAGEPIEARPVGQLTRSFLWAKRNRTLAATLGALVAVVLGASVLVIGVVAWKVQSEKARQSADKHAAEKREQDRIAAIELVHEAEASDRAGRAEAALASFDRAIELDAGNATAWFERGSLRLRRRNDDGAIADFTHAIELDPRLVAAFNERGLSELRKGELDLALADFVRVTELDPKHRTAWRSQAEVLEKKGDAAGAQRVLDAEIKKARGSAYAWRNRAWLRAQGRDLDGALADLNEAIRLDPKDATSWFERGCARESRSDAAGAISDFTHAIGIDPHYEAARSRRANLRTKANDWDGLIADCTTDIDVDPTDAASYGHRAEAKAQKSDLDGAIADYSRELELTALKGVPLAARAAIKLRKGDADGAIADATKALQVQLNFGPAFRVRGAARAKKGQRAEAIEDYESYLKFSPGAPDGPKIRVELELLKRAN
jgi:tetratricopeptide (TPR) repeat protein